MKLPQLEGSWAPLQYPQPLLLARRWSPVHVKMSSVRPTARQLHDLLCIIHSHWFGFRALGRGPNRLERNYDM